MANFVYLAKNGPLETVNGEVEALTFDEALRKISALGYVPIKVRPFVKSDGVKRVLSVRREQGIVFRRRVSSKLVCELIRQLYDLVDAGIAIISAVELAERGTTYPTLKKALIGMRQRLYSGESLSMAMGAYPDIFPAVFVLMVRSGEASGRIPETLESIQILAEKDLILREKVFGSLIYPSIVLGVGVLTVLVMLTVVMPKLTALFEDFDTALPAATQIVMAMSRIMADYWWFVAAVAGAAGWMLSRYLATSSGRMWLDRLVLGIPVLRDLVCRSEMARVSRSLAMLITGGVSLPLALGTCLDMVSNTVLKNDLADVVREVKSGLSLSMAVKHKPLLWSETAVRVVTVGEETGNLHKGLYKLAASLDREIEVSAGILVTVLGPAVLLLVAGVVGVMILSILLPLFQMNMIVK